MVGASGISMPTASGIPISIIGPSGFPATTASGVPVTATTQPSSALLHPPRHPPYNNIMRHIYTVVTACGHPNSDKPISVIYSLINCHLIPSVCTPWEDVTSLCFLIVDNDMLISHWNVQCRWFFLTVCLILTYWKQKYHLCYHTTLFLQRGHIYHTSVISSVSPAISGVKIQWKWF